MIKKVAETHALKKAFGISGVQSMYDFEVHENVAKPINTETPSNQGHEAFLANLDKKGYKESSEKFEAIKTS
jgi:hypothetical protein